MLYEHRPLIFEWWNVLESGVSSKGNEVRQMVTMAKPTFTSHCWQSLGSFGFTNNDLQRKSLSFLPHHFLYSFQWLALLPLYHLSAIMPTFMTIVKDTSPILDYSANWRAGTSESDPLMDQ